MSIGTISNDFAVAHQLANIAPTINVVINVEIVESLLISEVQVNPIFEIWVIINLNILTKLKMHGISSRTLVVSKVE